MSVTSNNTEYGPLADYAREAQRNAELSARLADAKNPVVSRLIQDALEASGAQLSEMTSEPKQLRELMTAHAALCHEIGLRVNDSEEMQAIDELVATSGDLVSVEQVSSARNEIAEAYADDVFAELIGIPEEIIDQLYTENICLELDGFATKAPHDESGALQEQPSTVEDDPGDVLRVVEPGYDPTADVVSEQSSEADTDRSRSEAHMTIDYEAETLAIGRRADRARASRIARGKKSQYVIDRARLLVAISENRGKNLQVRELWEQAFGEREFDRAAMAQHRAWLSGLRYGNKPLVVHNRRKGPESAYQISDIDLKITHQNTQPAVLSSEEEKEAAEPSIGESVGHDQSVDISATEQAEPQPTDQESRQVRKIMREVQSIIEAKNSADVDYGHLYSLAITIHSRADFLRAMNVPLPSVNFVESIDEYAESHGIDIHVDIKELQQRQKEAFDPLIICRMQALKELTTKDELMEYVDKYDEDHPVVALLEYVTSLDADQTERLMQVISGELTGVYEKRYTGGIRRTGQEVSYIDAMLTLPNGEVVEVRTIDPRTEGEIDDDNARKDSDDGPLEEAVDTADTQDGSNSADNGDTVIDLADKGDVAPEKKKKLTKIEVFKKDVGRILEDEVMPALESLGVTDVSDDTQTIARSQLQSQFNSVTARHVRNLAENGHISRENARAGIKVKDAILVILFANADIKERLSNKRYRKAADKVISDYIDKVKAG